MVEHARTQGGGLEALGSDISGNTHHTQKHGEKVYSASNHSLFTLLFETLFYYLKNTCSLYS